MKIRWLDKTNGLKDFSRWSQISRDKALVMLRRADPNEYAYRLHRLSSGDDVLLPRYALREDDAKFRY